MDGPPLGTFIVENRIHAISVSILTEKYIKSVSLQNENGMKQFCQQDSQEGTCA